LQVYASLIGKLAVFNSKSRFRSDEHDAAYTRPAILAEPTAASMPDVLVLERRILFSATPLPNAAELAGDAGSADIEAADVPDASDGGEFSDAAIPDLIHHVEPPFGTDLPGDASDSLTRELFFIDAGADNLDQLLNELSSNDDPTREVDVVLLSDGRDGIEQISETLASYDGLDAVHIISGGGNGAMKDSFYPMRF
jgi:hypothetical protein